MNREAQGRLARQIGWRTTATVVVSNMVGAGIFTTSGFMARSAHRGGSSCSGRSEGSSPSPVRSRMGSWARPPGEGGENTFCPACRAVLIERYGLDLLANRVHRGCCPDCGSRIPGVW